MIYSKKALEQIRTLLLARKQTLAVAESVTSGHLQAAFSTAEDANCFFQGGITTYNIGQKCRHLSVEPIHAIEYNCVSKDITIQMAKQVSGLFVSDYGIAVTGYATPVPEKEIKELFAWVSVVYHGKAILTKKISPEKAKAFHAQVRYANCILDEFVFALKKQKPG